MRIYKYPIHLKKKSVFMPAGARILTVQMQGDTPTIWALVDPAKKPCDRLIHVFGTGWDIPKHIDRYIGTWQDGGFVWHLFEEQ